MRLRQPSLQAIGLLRPLAWGAAGDLAARGSTLVVTVAVARAMSPEGFAAYLGLAALALLSIAAWDLGGSMLLTREVAAGSVSTRAALERLVRLRIRTLPVWLAVFMVGTLVISRSTELGITATVLFGLVSLAAGSHTLTLAALRAELRFREGSTAVALGRWATAILSLGVLVLGHGDGPLALLALCVLSGEVLTLSATVVHLRGRHSQGGEHRDPGEVLTLRRAAPFAANSFLALAYNRLDIVLVAALTSTGAFSAYAPASRLQDALYIVSGTLGMVALPTMSQAIRTAADPAQEIHRQVRLLIALGLAVASPVVLLVTVFPTEILRFVLGNEYVAAAEPLRILVWFLPFAVISAPLLAALTAMGRAVDTTKIFALTFFVAIALHVILDPWLGATGAALAALGRDPLAVLATVVLYRRAQFRLTSTSVPQPRLSGIA